MKRAILVLTAVVLVFPTATNASVILSDSGRGWIASPNSPNGNDPNNNYFAGNLGLPYRDHFDFPIPTLSGTLTGATLTLDNSGHSGGTNTFSVSSIGAFGSYAFANIGAGTPYGSVNISGNGAVTISLDAAALADITADQGGTFSIGGVNSAENGSFTYDFGFTGLGSSTTLTLNGVNSVVPEPATITLLGTGILAIGALRLRRRAAGPSTAC